MDRGGGHLNALALVLVLLFISSLDPLSARAEAHGEMADSGAVEQPSVDVSSKEVGVNMGSGAATLSIPVDLPPGRSDLEPNITISYSSDRGNGLLGVGWDIDFPIVTTSARAEIPDYENGARYEHADDLAS